MRLPVLGELNLATKLLGLFGLAVAGVALLALLLPFARMQALVDTGQLETARALYEAWAVSAEPALADEAVGADGNGGEHVGEHERVGDAVIQRFPLRALRERAREDWRYAEILTAIELAVREGERPEEVFRNDWRDWEKRYIYARIEWPETGPEARPGEGAAPNAQAQPAPSSTPASASEPLSIVVLERTSEQAAAEAAINSLFLLSAGVLVLAVALTVFMIIIRWLVLKPVTTLRLWAESVGDGNTDERVEIATGDEFQQLAETFNQTLDQLEEREKTLQSINIAMDVRLNELSEVNEALDKAARLKSEFLAGVSHELRTPLNSIIGFAELLLDIAIKEARTDETNDAVVRRKRYLENIVEGSRGLLELIEGLLEMARIEAGKTEINRELLNPVDACRGMLGLAEPLAKRHGVTLELDERPEVPLVETDPRKFQQIVFNLVTNAIKFTGAEGSDGKPGRVLVRVERVPGERGTPNVRVSVIDNGPGIDPADQQAIFDRFSQLEGGHERRHGGVGLGLAICRDLTTLLQADLQLVSEIGQGAMFSVLFPLRLDMSKFEESRLEGRFRGALNRQSG
jgi:two-component system sensor histidine kinase BarA